MVVSVIEITTIVLLVMVRHAESLMTRMIRHDAIVRKCWGRTRVEGWQVHRVTGNRYPVTLPRRHLVTLVSLEPILLGINGIERNFGDLIPQRIGDRSREEADRLGDALRPAHADDGRRHARVTSRELQCDSRKGHAVPLGDGGISTHAVDHLGGRLLIGVARIGVGAFCQHTAAVGSSIQDGHTASHRSIDEWLRGAVEQGVAVVMDHRVEEPGLDVLELHGDRSTRDAEVTDDALFAELLEDIDRSARSHCGFEGRPLLIVEIDDLDAIDAEQLKGAFHPALDRLAGVVVVLRIAPLFGLEERVFWQPTALAQDKTNASLALAVTVEGGGVDVGDRTVKRGANGGQRVLFQHPVGERLGHIANGCAPDGNGWDQESGLAERFTGQGISGGGGHWWLLQMRKTSTGGCYPSDSNAAMAEAGRYTW